MKKVEIIKLAGQTGLRKVGTVLSVPDKTATYWVKNKWAKRKQKPKTDK